MDIAHDEDCDKLRSQHVEFVRFPPCRMSEHASQPNLATRVAAHCIPAGRCAECDGRRWVVSVVSGGPGDRNSSNPGQRDQYRSLVAGAVCFDCGLLGRPEAQPSPDRPSWEQQHSSAALPEGWFCCIRARPLSLRWFHGCCLWLRCYLPSAPRSPNFYSGGQPNGRRRGWRGVRPLQKLTLP